MYIGGGCIIIGGGGPWQQVGAQDGWHGFIGGIGGIGGGSGGKGCGLQHFCEQAG